MGERRLNPVWPALQGSLQPRIALTTSNTSRVAIILIPLIPTERSPRAPNAVLLSSPPREGGIAIVVSLIVFQPTFPSTARGDEGEQIRSDLAA